VSPRSRMIRRMPAVRPKLLVGTLAATELVSWGILYYAFGVLVEPMQHELGWSQGLLGGALSLALLVSGALAVGVGRWIQRLGPRLVMSVGSLAGTLALLGWAEVTHPLAFYALALLLGAALAGTLYEPAFATVVGSLGRGRRTDVALLVLTIVGGLASTVFVPITQFLVEREGWRTALFVLAALMALLTLPAHLFLLPARMPDGAARDRAEPPAPLPRGGRLTRLASASLLGTLTTTSLGVFLVPALLECGHGPAFAASIASLIGLGQVAGRIAFTWLRPRYSLASWGLVLFGAPGLGLALVAEDAPAAWLGAGVFVFAMGAGAQTLIRPAAALELFPGASFAEVHAVLGRWALFGRAGAPLALGLLHDLFGSHRPGFWLLALACLIAALVAREAARGSASFAGGVGRG